MRRLALTTMASLLLAAPWAAMAQDGYVTVNLNMRAGPDVEYPLVYTIPVGTQVYVEGCTSDWTWCDVVAGGNRGWVDGDYLEYDYRDERVPLPAYGARIGVPIISFTIGDYWAHHYRHRWFYRDRDRWYRMPTYHHEHRYHGHHYDHRHAVRVIHAPPYRHHPRPPEHREWHHERHGSHAMARPPYPRHHEDQHHPFTGRVSHRPADHHTASHHDDHRSAPPHHGDTRHPHHDKSRSGGHGDHRRHGDSDHDKDHRHDDRHHHH